MNEEDCRLQLREYCINCRECYVDIPSIDEMIEDELYQAEREADNM